MPKKPAGKDAAPLKIGLVIDTSLDPTDGVQQYVLTIGEWLRRQGHEVHYLAGETRERNVPNLHSMTRNVRVNFNGNRTTIPLYARYGRLRQFLHSHQFDVLHVQTPHHPFLAQRIVLAASPGTAVLGTFHILPYNRLARLSTKLLGVFLQPSLRRFDEMLAVSPQAAAFEEWAFGLPAVILPNAFQYDRFHVAKPLSNYDDKVVTILFLGRLVERKGCQYLLEAIAQLGREHLPPFRVLVCGKGGLRDTLQRYVEEHELSSVVEFAGFVSETEKPRFYASANIAVFPSTAGESFGIVLLEAMASGRAAVLAGNNPGYSSVMSPRPDALFDPHDTAALAELLRRYLTDTAARHALAAWGMEYTRRFDVETVGQQLVERYNSLLARKNMR